MYGYVRPDKGELRVREYELFRAVYCGLCQALRERYGFLSRFAVNYDMTFKKYPRENDYILALRQKINEEIKKHTGK